MNKQFIIYNLQEAHEEIEIIFKAVRDKTNYTHEEYYRSMQHIFHHINLAYNGRDAVENPSEEEIEKWINFPKDLKVI